MNSNACFQSTLPKNNPLPDERNRRNITMHDEVDSGTVLNPGECISVPSSM